MNFFPKRTKYTKYQKGRIKNCLENKSNKLEFGFYGIQAIEQGKLTNKQLETIRKTISNKIKKQGKLWLKCFPDIPLTKKPTEIRMGKGKGSIHTWVAKIPKGKIILEITGKNKNYIKTILQVCLKKLPIKAIIISKIEKIK